MTSTHRLPSPTSPTSAPTAPPAAGSARQATGTSGLRRGLRALAIASCLPYLTLKTAWLAGSHVGIPEGSELRTPDGETTLFALNLLTVLMDAAVIVLAVALTRPWGRRLPAWLVLGPLWAATGLLAPILVGFPTSVLAEATSSGSAVSEQHELYLDDWVFTVVYSGFSVQALALGGLFALAVRDRWGHLLRGRLAGLPRDASRSTAGAAVASLVLLLWPLTMNLLWLGGSTAGLNGTQIENRDTTYYVTTASDLLFVLAAGAGVLLLAFRPARFARLRTATSVGLAWVGSAALGAWGGWLLLTSGANFGSAEADERTTALTAVTYAVQVLIGLLTVVVGARLLTARDAASAHRAA
ncbi:hypothetical protein [Streptomyces sp. B6B3]|uniref:hypothetical protein n=1 Tax=Streptomyces sp. B6B3 TaxID=3153570 RepID=UPI00325F8334